MRPNARPIATYAFAALFAAAPGLPALAPRSSTDATASSEAPRIRIDNFGQVDERYYRGAQPEGQDYADLAALGIKTVIDLQADGDNADESERVTAAGMNFVRIAMTGRVNPTEEQIAQFLAIVDDPSLRPVYVHCKVGKHRTGVMTAIYRMERKGWNAEQAFKEMKQYRFGWDFLHPEFKGFVFAYEPGNVQPSLPGVTAGKQVATAATGG